MAVKNLYKRGVLWLFSLCCVVWIPTYCLGLNNGEILEIKKDEFVPLFMTPNLNLKYEVGLHGNNCYDLDTVLPPDTLVRVDEILDNQNVVRVSCKVSKNCCFNGFIHRYFLENCANPASEVNFEAQFPQRRVMDVEKICEILDSCVLKKMPYTFGCNNFHELELEDLYSFEGPSADCRPYRCVGFDCSGLLHYISSWILPHNTKGLYNFTDGDCICCLDIDASDSELKNSLSDMQDTDFVVFIHDYQYSGGSGHVIISLHGGFIEAAGQNTGIVFTPKERALERLKKLLDVARNNGAKDVKVIRWHPNLRLR